MAFIDNWNPYRPYPTEWTREKPQLQRNAGKEGTATLVWMGRGRGKWKNRYRIHFKTSSGKSGSASYRAWVKGEFDRWKFHVTLSY